MELSMMYDVRDCEDDKIDKIIFSDDQLIEEQGSCILLRDCRLDFDFCVRKSDIANLQMALRKAKELWG
jgi:hypothetical protein